MIYLFKASDHPERNGRKPKHGEELFKLHFPLENDGKLTIELGRRGFRTHLYVITRALRDDPSLLKQFNEMLLEE